MVAEGKPIKAIAAAKGLPPEAVDAAVEAVFVKLAEGVSAGTEGALQRLRLLHKAIVDREEQGETLSRLLPGDWRRSSDETAATSARPNGSSAPYS